jgi:hypothetical protein
MGVAVLIDIPAHKCIWDESNRRRGCAERASAQIEAALARVRIPVENGQFPDAPHEDWDPTGRIV